MVGCEIKLYFESASGSVVSSLLTIMSRCLVPNCSNNVVVFSINLIEPFSIIAILSAMDSASSI